MRIGIAGAGIGGLSLAILLRDAGLHPEIFERFDAPKPVGSGLVIQPVGQDILAQMGCLENVLSHGNKITRMLGKQVRSGRRVLDVSYDPKQTGASYGLSIQRASIFDALYRGARQRAIPIHTSHAITGYADKHFVFEDRTHSDRFDLLVDASGARSKLSPLNSKHLSYGALWAKLDWDEGVGLDKTQLSQRYDGAHKMVGVMHTGVMPNEHKASAAFFWSLPADSYETWRQEGLVKWRSEALALWPEIEPFVAQIGDPDQFTMARYSHGTLRRPYREGIAFIGDAAHRASPQLGQGANMALLDAAALSWALVEFGSDKGPAAYAKARRLHVAIYQLMSWAFTPMYQSNSRILPFLRDRALFPLSQIPPVPKLLTSLVCGNMTAPIRSLPQTTPSTRALRSR
ncbi:FAD-dependent oxidoreductase [Aliiroseovarius sp. S253]|uniref:FAD-dependent oxidoreductase n=1 Tax=Aliiroseovarius sp. S253 TaxID=3415133 RepID=UPI003C7D39E0